MRSQRGFTLMELLVVLALVAILAGLVAPIVSNSIVRAKESTLKENLFIFRKAIDDYYADTGSYPPHLKDLMDKHYLRNIPVDPITEKKDTWVEVPADTVKTDDNSDPGIIDVHSGSDETAIDGQPYKEW